MRQEEQMFLVDEEQADEDGETSALWKRRHRQVLDPFESLPVIDTIHRRDLHSTTESVSYF
jgi:hypothetical protein